jgi:hypothetical protein
VVNPETDISYEQLDKEIKKAEEEEDRKSAFMQIVVFKIKPTIQEKR